MDNSTHTSSACIFCDKGNVFHCKQYYLPTLNHFRTLIFTHLSLASFLWDMGKQHSPRWDAAERGVPSGAILFAQRNLIEK